MDRDVLEGEFDVQCGPKTVLTKIVKYGDCGGHGDRMPAWGYYGGEVRGGGGGI